MNIEYKAGTLLILDSNIADYIAREFRKNYYSAKEKYTDKKFLISGVIYNLKPNPHSKNDIFFEEDYICIGILIPYLKRKRFYRRILCYIKYGKNIGRSLFKGAWITLKGVLDFDTAAKDIAFRECEVVND